MALELITGAWTGSHAYELRQFFASAADRIVGHWPDPAGFGPDISDVLDEDQAKMRRARAALREAACTRAILLDRQGKTGEALSAWRSLFGDLFPCHDPGDTAGPRRLTQPDQGSPGPASAPAAGLYAVAQRWHRAGALGTFLLATAATTAPTAPRS